VLLRDVLGENQHLQFRSAGYLDIPSGRFRGRTYRLDSAGNLSYRDAGESTFNTTLCVQPIESVPRDDQIAMRYLLVTADEDRLLEVANPITFGFVSLTRALYHDLGQKRPAWAAALLTSGLLGFFLAATAAEGWILLGLLPRQPALAIVLFLVLLLPALVGVVLVLAALVEAFRAVQNWRARRALAAIDLRRAASRGER
jgi:hypothetical protein